MITKKELQVEIAIDTREQNPAVFPIDKEYKSGRLQVLGSKVQTLDTGDYSLIGYENVLRIERKAGFAELHVNLMSGSENKDRFLREMERMTQFDHRYILIESNISKDSLTLGIPQGRYNSPTCGTVLKELIKIQKDYNIPFLFVGDAFVKTAKYIFETVVRDISEKKRHGTDPRVL
jgi:hypothetical protein